MTTEQIKNLDDMINSESYQIYESKTLLNPQHHMINNTDVDADLMEEYNADGMFGVSHSDFIECWRDYLNDSNIDETTQEAINKEIDECENWHIKNGSINNII